MDTFKLLGASFLRPLFAVVLLTEISGVVAAQVEGQAAQEQKEGQRQDQNQNQADKSVRPSHNSAHPASDRATSHREAGGKDHTPAGGGVISLRRRDSGLRQQADRSAD